MRSLPFVSTMLLAVAFAGGPGVGPVSAQTEVQAVQQQIAQLRQDFDALTQQYGERLTALEARLGAIQGGQAAPISSTPSSAPPPAAQVPAGAEGAGGPSGTLPVYGNAAAASKVFNPDMAVIGDFLGAAGDNTVNPAPALSMHETELTFQAIVDPYARADFFVAVGAEGVELEEGFITFPSLPGGLLTKVGQMRAAFGKVNTMHNHILPWTDRPIVINNLVGGEEGISDAGLSVARLIPAGGCSSKRPGRCSAANSGEIFQSSERGDLSYAAHLRGYQDITDNANIDFGASYSRGHNATGVVAGIDIGRFTTDLFGVDATYRWRPLQRSIYRSFTGRTEWIWSRRERAWRPSEGTGPVCIRRLSVRAPLVRRRALRSIGTR